MDGLCLSHTYMSNAFMINATEEALANICSSDGLTAEDKACPLKNS